MTDTTTAIAPGRTIAGLKALLDDLKPRLADVLPRHLTPERVARVVLLEAARNPRLYDCTPTSLGMCILTASQLGLEPSSPMGLAYLIPRRNYKTSATECTLLIGYKGYTELARRSGEIARITAEVVYRDEMDRSLWMASIEPPEITHQWALDIDRSETSIVAAYARAVLRDGSVAQVILTVADIARRRDRSQAREDGPWVTDFPAMARKSALRALLSGGLVPLSAEMAQALDEDADRADPIRVDMDPPAPVRTAPATRDAARRSNLDQALQEPAPPPTIPESEIEPQTPEQPVIVPAAVEAARLAEEQAVQARQVAAERTDLKARAGLLEARIGMANTATVRRTVGIESIGPVSSIKAQVPLLRRYVAALTEIAEDRDRQERPEGAI